MSSSTIKISVIIKIIPSAWSLKFSETFHIYFLVTFSLPSSEAGRADVMTSVLQWKAPRCGEAEDPGVSWIVAELDLDLHPLPPGLGTFCWTWLMRALMKQRILQSSTWPWFLDLTYVRHLSEEERKPRFIRGFKRERCALNSWAVPLVRHLLLLN